MRIVYSGAVVSNGGDAAIMAAQIDLLSEAFPGHLPAIHDLDREVAQRLFPGADVCRAASGTCSSKTPGRLGRVATAANALRMLGVAHVWGLTNSRVAGRLLGAQQRETLTSIATADLVAYTGGTTLIERYPLRGKLFELNLARALRRPVVWLPASLGPFKEAHNRRAIKRAVADADLVMLRDARSMSHLVEIGADTQRVRQLPDVVFAVSDPAAIERLAASEVPSSPSIVISVRDNRRFFTDRGDPEVIQDAYEEALAQAVTHWVSTTGARVTFASTCQGVPEYWTDDSEVAVSIVRRLTPGVCDSVTVDGKHRGHQELLDLYGSFDVAITTRMHAGILALCAGTPVLPIAYEFKTHEVMGQVGLGDLVLNADSLTAEQLVAGFTALCGSWSERRKAVAENLTAMTEELAAVVPVLRERVAERARGVTA